MNADAISSLSNHLTPKDVSVWVNHGSISLGDASEVGAELRNRKISGQITGSAIYGFRPNSSFDGTLLQRCAKAGGLHVLRALWEPF